MKIKKILYLSLLFLLSMHSPLCAKTNIDMERSFTDKTNEAEKFLMHMDSIAEYLYRDIEVVEYLFEECETLIKENATFHDSILFQYSIEKIYYELNNSNLLESYKLVKENESQLTNKSISNRLKKDFTYIRAFTNMSLGDISTAQKAFQENIEMGITFKDTSQIILNTFSLGQLYADEKEFNTAIGFYLDLLDLNNKYPLKERTLSLVYYELSEAYLNSDQFDEALKTAEIGLKYINQKKIDMLKPDFLLIKGGVFLIQNKIEAAKDIYSETVYAIEQNKDTLSYYYTQTFLGDILIEENKLNQSFAIFETLLKQCDPIDIATQINLLEKIHPIAHSLNYPHKAYQYLEKKYQLEKEIEEQDKQQKTAYLKIKFETEFKEKENQKLAVQILEKQNQNEFLLFTAVSFFLSLFLLVIAFFQKKKYNETLKIEVSNRTTELENSNALLVERNQEIAHVNKILSHDLKEPLRSIVGFSYLAGEEAIENPIVKEYMRLIETSGKQLSQIIEDVSIYQNIDVYTDIPPELVKVDVLIQHVLNSTQKAHAGKAISLHCSNIIPIKVNAKLLDITFKTLIDNSVKFNTNELPEISIRYSLHNDKHTFVFNDNGIGIDPQFHQQIFNMFSRLNTQDQYVGSGLGLSMIKKLLTNIGGSIEIIQSQKNKGSTFLVTLPVL